MILLLPNWSSSSFFLLVKEGVRSSESPEPLSTAREGLSSRPVCKRMSMLGARAGIESSPVEIVAH